MAGRMGVCRGAFVLAVALVALRSAQAQVVWKYDQLAYGEASARIARGGACRARTAADPRLAPLTQQPVRAGAAVSAAPATR